eukprot:1836062-Pleurochrysis_carterae.AAC.1
MSVPAFAFARACVCVCVCARARVRVRVRACARLDGAEEVLLGLVRRVVRRALGLSAVSYTHLTLPTILLV